MCGVLARHRPNEITAAPRTSSPAPTTHPGEEFVYVIEGSITLDVDGKLYNLRPGGTLYYTATIPHRWHNPGDAEARFLLTGTPSAF